MGTDQSSLSALPPHLRVLEYHALRNRIIPIDQRDFPKEWKQAGHSFVYFVDQSVSSRPDTIQKVIHAAGSQLFYVENHQDYKVNFLLDKKGQDIIPTINIFRLRLEKQYFVGTVEEIKISSTDMTTLYEELYPTPIMEETNFDTQSSVNNDNQEQSESPTTENQQNSERRSSQLSNTSFSTTNTNTIQKTLQPNCKDNGITFTAISIRFDTERCLEDVTPRIFACLSDKPLPESNQLRNDSVPSIFSQISEEFKQNANKIAQLHGSKQKLGSFDLWKHSSQRESKNESISASHMETERKTFLGVEASKASRILGFLEQPWEIVIPNEPIITTEDVKQIMEQWQAYSQRFMIKLKWMNFIHIPMFVTVTERMIQTDLPLLSKDDESSLLSYCLEFWNKPDMNYHWTMSLKASDTTVAIWKTRMYFYKDEENEIVRMYKHFSFPIWSVVDEEAMKKLLQSQPPTLRHQIMKKLVSSFPHGKFYPNSSQFIPGEPRTLADFEKQILQGSSNRMTFSDSEESSDEESSEEKISNHRVTLSHLPGPLITELFHSILRQHGVTLDLEEVFGHGNANIQGLRIPHRFQQKNTRADSKAESLVVTLGSIVDSFAFLDLSGCTLSGESLDALAPRLTNLIELNLSRCTGIMEWGFLLSLRENLRDLNLSNLLQCGNDQQLCAMIAGLNQLQILDLSNSKMQSEHVLFHIPKLASLTSLDLRQDESNELWNITDEGLLKILEIKTLRSLFLPGNELSATSIVRLVDLPHLSELGFVHLIGLGKQSPLAMLTQLSSLSIESSEMFDNSVEGVLAGLTSLTRLNLTNNELTGESISALSMMKDLRTLKLADNQIGRNRNMDHHSFSSVPHLTELDLSGNPIVEMRPWMSRKQRLGHLDFLLELTHLKSLAMDHKSDENGIEDEGMNFFRNLTSLTTLSLKKQSLTDRCVRFLTKFTNLEKLDLAQNNITNEAIRELSSLQELHTLCVQDTILSDSSLVHMASIRRLRKVFLSNTRVTPNAITVMEKQFPYISIINS